jgi:hypothetical protein
MTVREILLKLSKFDPDCHVEVECNDGAGAVIDVYSDTLYHYKGSEVVTITAIEEEKEGV